MQKEKTWNMIGMVLGIAIILIGIIFCMTPPEHYSTSSVTSASFGGDFYTYEYDATRTAASNAAVTANNIREIGVKMAIYVGTFFIITGAQILIIYSKKYFCESNKWQSSIMQETEPEEYVVSNGNDTNSDPEKEIGQE